MNGGIILVTMHAIITFISHCLEACRETLLVKI